MSNAQAARVFPFDEASADAPIHTQFAPGAPDGGHAGTPHIVAVQTAFRGVGMGARILRLPHDVRRVVPTASLMMIGAALCLVALGVFATAAVDLASERRAFAAWEAGGGDPSAFPWKSRSRLWDVVFVGGLLSGVGLTAWGLSRRHTARGEDRTDFVIGSAPTVDAPVDARYVLSAAHRLVTTVGDGYVVHATPSMDGEITVAGESFALAELVRRQGPALRLPSGARARLRCGETTFVVASFDRPMVLDRPSFKWNADRDPYTLGAALALSVFLAMIFSVPADPRSLSLDLLGNEHRLISFRFAPPAEVRLPPELTKDAASERGGSGKAHATDAGRMGDRTSKERNHHLTIKGPVDNHDVRMANEQSLERARTAGILGVFKRLEGSPVASIFARDAALGDSAADVLGNLVGPNGSAWGGGGLGPHGTGAGGGGTGEGTLGVGHLGTLGNGTGAPGDGPGRYGQGVGQLANRNRHRLPDIIPVDWSVRGSLDKEIVRRTIRRHINEVKFCYEQELIRKPSLGGRIMVQFMISATGQVISSVLQSSTMGNARVESCTLEAVKRWPFPQPNGGGLVVVSYPFVLAPAGGA